MLRKPEVMEEVLMNRCSHDNILRDYCDGDFIQSLDVSENDLLLAFYYDGLEVVNPLGSRRGKHKLGKTAYNTMSCMYSQPCNNYTIYIYIGMFYWMLLNIRPAYRSTLHSIQLLAVANEKIINRYGIDAVLKPAVDELKELGSKV